MAIEPVTADMVRKYAMENSLSLMQAKDILLKRYQLTRLQQQIQQAKSIEDIKPVLSFLCASIFGPQS